MPMFGPTRAALAAAAARGAAILPALQSVFTAEALTAFPPAFAQELNAETDALCVAARELAACRSGWLRFYPADCPLPVRLPRGLLHSTVLIFLRGVLRSGAAAELRLVPMPDAAALVLRGGNPGKMPGDLPTLLHHCGPFVTADDGGQYAAAVRLALAPDLPLRASTKPEDLLLDRYSAARVYLHGYCVEEDVNI